MGQGLPRCLFLRYDLHSQKTSMELGDTPLLPQVKIYVMNFLPFMNVIV